MDNRKYIGWMSTRNDLDRVLDSAGKLVMKRSSKPRPSRSFQFVQGLRGDCTSPWEEGNLGRVVVRLLRPYVTEVLVCDPRKNALLKVGKQERPH